MVKVEINSIRLDMKLVFEFAENMDWADNYNSPDVNRTTKHGKVMHTSFLREVACVYAEKRH